MKHWLLAAAIICFGSSVNAQDLTPSVSTPSASGISQFDRQRIDALDLGVQELTSGNPTITGLPKFKQGIKFSDGTTQTTAATASSTIGVVGALLASTTVSGLSSKTLSGLNGNAAGRIRVVIEGTLAAAADATISLLRPNNDTTNYRSEGIYGFGGGSGAIAANTTGIHIWRAYGTAANTVCIDVYLRAGPLNAGARPFHASGGGQQSGVGGFTVTTGGAWTDTSTNLTSLTFAWGSAFTGNVYVYQD